MEEKLTATKYEILKEFRLSDWEFDTISKKHNIRSVKNFVDERGQFIALYEKQHVVEAIKANANKKILEWEACKNNPKLITRKELADLWKMPIIRVYDELKKRKIKPFKKTITDSGYNQYFYRKKDCGIVIEKPEKKQDIRAEESAKSDKQKEIEKWLNDDRYVQRKDLLKLWGLKPRGVTTRISRKKLKPSKKFNNGKHGLIAFYSKAECISIENEFKYKNKTGPVLFNNQEYVPACGLELLWGISRSKVSRILRNSNIKGVKKSASSGYRMFYSRAECEAARPFIKEVKNEMEEQKLINTPIEADFIPADTLDSYTLPALTVKLKEKGATIENFKADLFDNHADEDVKRIGMLIRGSVKSVNLWGRQIDDVVNLCNQITDKKISPQCRYAKEFCDIAAICSMNGENNFDICRKLQISDRTLYNWMDSFPEFKAAVESGRQPLSAQIKQHPLAERVESLEKEVSELKSFISDLKILLAKHA